MFEEDFGLSPEDVATATMLITLILIAAGFTVDAASSLAVTFVEAMGEQAILDRVPGELGEEDIAEVESSVDAFERELGEEIAANGMGDTLPQNRETVGYSDWEVISDAIEGSKDDVIEAMLEASQIGGQVAEALEQTIEDLRIVDADGIDWDKIDGIKGDLLTAGQTLHGIVEALSQLAGNQFAGAIDQDANVMAALELLTILARQAAMPSSLATDNSVSLLHELLTSRSAQVMSGLQTIAIATGKGAFELGRMAIGAQEWQNAINGDLSPLTRITNALFASAQTAGLLHGMGTSMASRFGDDAIAGARYSGLLDEAAEGGASARRGWPWETRRNPDTGALEVRQNPGEAFQPLPDDVAEAMRNQPLSNGQYRMNPDTGEVEWRNPRTSQIEPAPLDNDIRPGYEQTARTTATGRDADLRNLPEGAIVPDELLPQTGYAPHQIEELRRIAREKNVVFGSRTTNMDSLRHIANRTATPKPVDIKSKTIQELDTFLGASKDDVRVGGDHRVNHSPGVCSPGPTGSVLVAAEAEIHARPLRALRPTIRSGAVAALAVELQGSAAPQAHLGPRRPGHPALGAVGARGLSCAIALATLGHCALLGFATGDPTVTVPMV